MITNIGAVVALFLGLNSLPLAVNAQNISHQTQYADGSGEWRQAFQKAKDVVAGMTLEEKLNVTLADGSAPRVKYPGIVWSDGPNGVRGFTGHSAVPSALTSASSFDRELLKQRGIVMGKEAYDAGFVTLLGPMMNHFRAPEGGRNFEGFGADSYLTACATVETLVGIQSQGVGANLKHFILNEQEYARTYSNSLLDQQALREIYLPPFEEGVRAGAVSTMCSYNQINGTYACENGPVIDILKKELNFQGYLMTDFGASHSNGPEMNAGTDLALSGLTQPAVELAINATNSLALGEALLPWINNGSVTMERIDDAATRILSAYYKIEQANKNKEERPKPAVGFRNVQAKKHQELIRKLGAASTVLLRNENSALPLNKPQALAVFGSDATYDPLGPNLFSGIFPGSGGGTVGGRFNRFGASANGTVAMGFGSGWTEFPLVVTPLEAIQTQAREDLTTVQYVLDNYDNGSIEYLASRDYNDACLVFINADSGEAIAEIDGNIGDRNNLTAWSNGDNLVELVASQCNNTIVIAHAPGPLLMPWIDHENVTALVWAGMPGQESGNSLVDVMYGKVNPSGRLVYTIAKELQDYTANVEYFPLVFNGTIYPVNYTEGILTDYRGFQANNVSALFEYGFGLSYTNFTYKDLSVKPFTQSSKFRRAAISSNEQTSTPYTQDLYEEAYTVTANIKNTGKRDGYEVAQLYIQHDNVNLPFRAMKGFDKIWVAAGKTEQAKFVLRKRDVSIWDTPSHSWVQPKSFKIFVGKSSEILPLEQQISN